MLPVSWTHRGKGRSWWMAGKIQCGITNGKWISRWYVCMCPCVLYRVHLLSRKIHINLSKLLRNYKHQNHLLLNGSYLRDTSIAMTSLKGLLRLMIFFYGTSMQGHKQVILSVKNFGSSSWSRTKYDRKYSFFSHIQC